MANAIQLILLVHTTVVCYVIPDVLQYLWYR